MTHLQGDERAKYVQNMFDRIAGRYNLMNRLMTFGQDRKWRKFAIEKAQLSSHDIVLDLATGTGDIAFEAIQQNPDTYVIGGDFSLGMMLVGQKEPHGEKIDWCGTDAMQLPFGEAQFDAVVSGYLVRNVIDISKTLQEQKRILKSGGRIVILDTSPPPNNILRPFILIHLRYIIPILGRIIAGKSASDAYQYLPESTQSFKTPAELAELMQQAGFGGVQYKSFMFGTMSVHWGINPQ